MRISIHRPTKKIIEMQSGGSTQAHLDTLTQNAINAGYTKEDVEVKFCTEEEYAAALEEAITIPEAIATKQKAVKSACKGHIHASYPAEIQDSMNFGIYPSEVVDTAKAFIAACIIEENRVYDLLVLATTKEQVNVINPSWPMEGKEVGEARHRILAKF